MTVHRSALPQQDYVVVSNAVVRDARLSLKARAILIDLLSRPRDWRPRAEFYVSRHRGESIRPIRDAFNELVAAGYLVRVTTRDPQTQCLQTENHVFDTPQGDADASGETRATSRPLES